MRLRTHTPAHVHARARAVHMQQHQWSFLCAFTAHKCVLSTVYSAQYTPLDLEGQEVYSVATLSSDASALHLKFEIDVSQQRYSDD